jgi:hypothetical protein
MTELRVWLEKHLVGLLLSARVLLAAKIKKKGGHSYSEVHCRYIRLLGSNLGAKSSACHHWKVVHGLEQPIHSSIVLYNFILEVAGLEQPWPGGK